MSSTTYIKCKSIYYVQEGLYISNCETRAQLNLCKNIIYLQREIALRYESLASLLLSKNSWFWNVYISVFKHNSQIPTYLLANLNLKKNKIDFKSIWYAYYMQHSASTTLRGLVSIYGVPVLCKIPCKVVWETANYNITGIFLRA